MGSSPIDPSHPVLQGFMLVCYMIGLLSMGYAVFGIARTAATRLPIPGGKWGEPKLFPVDITPKLYSFSGKGRKALKIVIFALIGLFYCAFWLISLRWTYKVQASWFGWGWGSDSMVFTFHCLLAVLVLTLLGVRGAKYANRFDPPPAV